MLIKQFDKTLLKIGFVAAKYHGMVHPVTGKKPPTLEEFDPLDPGEWQLGAGGKILPRLPEGTRCGKLVMGKYGLYSPEYREDQQAAWDGTHEGTLPTEFARPIDRKIMKIVWIFLFIATIVNIYGLALIHSGTREKPLWPYKPKKVAQ